MEEIQKIRDFISLSIESVRSRRLRSWLTVIGVVIGVTAIVSLMSLSQGFEGAIQNQFETVGTDKVFILSGSSFFSPVQSANKLDTEDLETVEETRGVERVAGFAFKTDAVEFNNRQRFFFIIGVDEEVGQQFFEQGAFSEVDRGRFFSDGAHDEALIGWGPVNQDVWFGRTLDTGNRIEVSGEKFEIVGTLERIGNDQDDTNVYLPLDRYRSLFGEEDTFDYIIARAEGDVTETAASIKEELRDSRGLERGEEDFTVQTSQQLLESFGSVLDIINIAVLGIAGISVLVGGIGVSNAMFTSVYERHREIGIMKAVGGTNTDIFILFLMEAAIVGLIGGIVGTLLGFGISIGVAILAQQVTGTVLVQAAVTPTIVGFAFMFSLGVGIISGSIPARRASRLHPVEAIRR